MINILHGAKQARPQGSERERQTDGERKGKREIKAPPKTSALEHRYEKTQRKIQVTATLLVNSAAGGALVSPISDSRVFNKAGRSLGGAGGARPP